MKCLYTCLAVLMMLEFITSCKKKCDGEGQQIISKIQPGQLAWFNFPEGTQKFYESNTGERDTVTFGKPELTQEKFTHNSDDCYTPYLQKLIQEITWKKNLKGRTRPKYLVSHGETNTLTEDFTFTNYKYQDGDLSILPNDTVLFKNNILKDVKSLECNTCEMYSWKYSKSIFLIEFSYLNSDNSLETWHQQ